MPRSPFAEAFERVLKEHGENQTQAAVGLEVTPAHISALVRGVGKPSRDLTERIITRYKLPADEWLQLAGHKPAAAPMLVTSNYDALVQAAVEALRLQRETLEPAQYFGIGLQELARKYNLDRLVMNNFGGLQDLTIEGARRMLREIEEDILAELEEERQAASRRPKP